MKKITIKLGKPIKVRRKFAPIEKVYKDKMKYNRKNKHKNQTN